MRRRPNFGAPLTATQLDRQLAEMERFAHETWSNIAMADKVKAFRREFRLYLQAQQVKVDADVEAFKPVVVTDTTRWG